MPKTLAQRLETDAATRIYYDDAFRRVLECHMPWLREHPNTTRIVIENHDSYQFEGDLYTLFLKNGIAAPYHWLVMRLNGYYRRSDVDEQLTTLLIPDFSVVENLRQMHVACLEKQRTA